MMNNSQGASSFFSGLSTLLGRPHPLLHNLSDTTLQGERSPNALLDGKQVREVLDDWDDEKGYWRNSAGHWGKLLRVSPSTILAARRGDTWKHLKHSNAGRKKDN